MRKRRWVSWVIIVGCALTVAVFEIRLWYPPEPDPGVSLQNFRRIRAGMTEHEVERILGWSGSAQWLFFGDLPGDTIIWHSDDAEICVKFREVPGGQPTVISAVYNDLKSTKPLTNR